MGPPHKVRHDPVADGCIISEIYTRMKKVQPEPRKAGLTDRKQPLESNRSKATARKHKNFKEPTMDMDGNIVPVAAIMVPIVGSIALFSFLGVASWSDARRKEREAYYRSETLKKIAESSGEAGKSALELMREQEKNFVRRRLEGLKIGGLVTTAVGIGVMALLRGLEHDDPVYLAGLIPLLIGVALLIYPFLLAPKEQT
jgi:hypothetical protein